MGIEFTKNGIFFNGKKKDMVWGRSSFKLSNIVTYHFTGQGSGDHNRGHYSLGDALRWIEHNQRIFGEDVILRVFLETAGWDDSIDRDPNGVPNNGMFGSEPSDQGFWNLDALRDGHRETSVHYVGRKTIEWFYQVSEQTGVAFELVINATLKHNDIPNGEMDHVVRQVGVFMGELRLKYPKALVVVSTANEWNAHSRISLREVDMWATRWYRDQYWEGSNFDTIPLIVDGGGSDTFEYQVGQRNYHAGMIHPERGPNDRLWWELPDLAHLRMDSHGYPIGFTESMYYVEEEDVPRAEGWYRNRRGWNHVWRNFERFYERWEGNIDYGIIHDEKGAGTLTDWPRKMTRMEQWAKGVFNGGGDGPPPPPPPPDDEPTDCDYKPQLDRIEGKVDRLLEYVDFEEPIDDDPPVIPRPSKKPTDYIQWSQREAWASRVDLAYTLWRGHRDLEALHANLGFVHGRGYLKDLREKSLSLLITVMVEASKRQERLIYRIKNERHREFGDRSQVRKSVANDMIAEMKMLSREYYEIANKLPEVPGCDSIACKIKKWKEG